MIAFKNYEQYTELTRSALNNKLKNINCYLMPQEITDLINQGRLFYILDTNTLEIIIEYDRYFKVNFYANDEFKFLVFDADNPIITDLPFSNHMPERTKAFEALLLSQGFKLNTESTRMSLDISDLSQIEITPEYRIVEIQKNDIQKIYNLWEENFDPIQNLLYSQNEMLEHSQDLYVCMDSQNNICGAMEIIISGKTGWIQRIAVDDRHKRKGIGSIMESFYINKCKSLGINKLLLYTIDDNDSAVAFHKKFGFLPDGKKNCQYIFKQ